MSEPTFENMWERYECSVAAHRVRAAIITEIADIIEPWERAICAAEAVNARVTKVRMPADALQRLQIAHDRLSAEKHEPPYDVVSLYGLPIVRTA